MTRILYGLCGEGLGHASRSRILINYLLNRGYKIHIVAGGKAYSYMKKEFTDVEEIESPRFIYRENQVLLWPTILRMMFRTFVKTPFSYMKIRRILHEFKPDVLITDAEPISHFAAFSYGIPRMSIDNPQAILYRPYSVDSGEFWSWFALKVAVKVSMWNADRYVIYDFSDEQINNAKILFVKPLIQEGILRETPKYGTHVFVYQTSISTRFICDVLQQVDENFIIYGFDKNQVEGNLIFKRFNDDEFYQDIAHAKAVITNGGFTVLSEALYLKKPIFSLPIKNQFEQMMNGKFIQQLGVGEYHTSLDVENLEHFFNNLKNYQKNARSYDPGNQHETLHQIEQKLQRLVASSGS